MVWDGSKTEKYWQKWLSEKPFTTLFVDGNHENFETLNKLPVKEKFGGFVGEVAPNIYHLKRGQVLDIDGKRFFVMGGASSHDKLHRIEGVSWWQDELPTRQETNRALKALDACGWGVDFVITHCAPSTVQQYISIRYEPDYATKFLEYVRQNLEFKRWFFGHYHIDLNIGKEFRAIYNDVLRIL